MEIYMFSSNYQYWPTFCDIKGKFGKNIVVEQYFFFVFIKRYNYFVYFLMKKL
jgi:hypothetical protein